MTADDLRRLKKPQLIEIAKRGDREATLVRAEFRRRVERRLARLGLPPVDGSAVDNAEPLERAA
jgi:hypothetical protein